MALPADGQIISLEKDPGRCAIAVANERASTVAEKIDIHSAANNGDKANRMTDP
jgi:predicted O-methyltransferase YrrM